jgi:hypothetical protein
LKRKITYGFLIILLISGICLGLNFTFGFFTPFNFWTAHQDIKKGKIQIVEIGEIPLNFEQKQKLANSYGFNFYELGCNVSMELVNGTRYYNKAIVCHLENKLGTRWWTKFQNKLDSIDKAKSNIQKQLPKRLAFKNISEIVADKSNSVWVEKQDSNFSLALHFQYKDTLAVSYSPECWLMYPYKIYRNKIIVYWDNNIDTKYDFDIIKAINKTDKKYIGKPFMVLELQNDTIIRATYLLKELIKKVNNSNKERTFFSNNFNLVQDGEMYD